MLKQKPISDGGALLAGYRINLKKWLTEQPHYDELKFLKVWANPETEKTLTELKKTVFRFSGPEKIKTLLMEGEPMTVLDHYLYWLDEHEAFYKWLLKREKELSEPNDQNKKVHFSTLDKALREPHDLQTIIKTLEKAGLCNSLGKWTNSAPGSQSDAAKWIKTENEKGTFKRRLTIREMQNILKNSFGIEKAPSRRTFNNCVVFSFK